MRTVWNVILLKIYTYQKLETGIGPKQYKLGIEIFLKIKNTCPDKCSTEFS